MRPFRYARRVNSPGPAGRAAWRTASSRTWRTTDGAQGERPGARQTRDVAYRQLEDLAQHCRPAVGLELDHILARIRARSPEVQHDRLVDQGRAVHDAPEGCPVRRESARFRTAGGNEQRIGNLEG